MLLASVLAITSQSRSATTQSVTNAPRIGWLTVQKADGVAAFIAALRAGLADRGYVEGRGITIEYRFGNDVAERVSELASDLMGLQVKLIVAQGAAVPILHKLALPVPIIYAFSGDPVAAGFADSLARPHRNMTGVTLMTAELSGKRLELLKDLIPDLRRVAILARPEHPGEPRERAYCEEAANKLGLAIAFFPTSKPQEIDAAFAAMAADPPQGILVLPDGFMVQNRHRLLEAAAIHRVPLVSGWRIFAESGAVCTYGPTLTESYRRLAYFVDRVLRGAKLADLPVEQPTRFELVVNLKVAKALGLTVPPLLLARADEVIE